ncbi:MAG TPA: antibiotic biosynthesis monooxygenase [Bacteroidetes bacterium]|nr:antibiotic biosynthesis monooxygenase [Bacteroidota bacterium]
MKIITVFCIAKPEFRSELIKLCKSMIVPSRSEQGCLHYSFYQDLDRENKFFFYEEWVDQPSIDAHNISRHFLDFQPKFKSFIEGEPEINVHTVK